MRTNLKRGDRGLTVTRAVLLVAALSLIGVLTYRQVDGFAVTRVPVWISTEPLAAGATVDTRQMTLVQAPPPAGAIIRRADIVGQTLAQPKAEGDPFYARDFVPRPAPDRLAATVPPGRLLATVRVDNMDLPVPQLRPGDRLDVVQAGSKGVTLVAHDVYMMGTLTMRTAAAASADSGRIMGVDISIPGANTGAPSGAALVLALRPQDVFPLAAAEASGRAMKIVLHAGNEVAAGALLDVRPPRPAVGKVAGRSVEILSGGRRDRVRVNNR